MEMRDRDGLTEQEFLAAYKPGDYERPSMTADIAVFSLSKSETKLLLIRRGNHPCLGKWALPGGFVEKGESVCIFRQEIPRLPFFWNWKGGT